MERLVNAELQDDDTSYYVKLYFYDPAFVTDQCIIRNSQLNPNLIYQLIEVLNGYNPFINIYNIAAKWIETPSKNTIEETCIIFNLQTKLLLELEADRRYGNLFTIDKLAIIILDEYE